MMHRQFINSCMSCSSCFFPTNSSQFFNLLVISCMIFLKEPISQFQFSIRVDFSSLSLIFPSTCLLQLKSLRFKLLIDLLKSDVRISLFPIFRLNFCLSSIQFLLSHSLSSNSRINLPFKDFVETVSVSLRMHDVLIAISLPF